MLPALGKIVKYTLSQADVTSMLHEAGHLPDGFRAGQQAAAIIVNPGSPPSTCANLHVFLDGPAWHYVVASPHGRGEGQWYDLPLS
jgi:hypothetical protein